MKMPRLAIALLIAFAALPAAAQDPGPGLEAALKNPPATGLMVTTVLPESQAATIGLRPGDVVVSYAGAATPDLEALNARKAEVGELDVVEILWRSGDDETIYGASIKPGMIGFNGVAVVKGEAAATLPEATGVAFDFSSLDAGPVERWSSFSLGDAPKSGYEMWRLSKAGNRLFLRSEVAFDGGEEWGPEHMRVTVVMTAEPRPRLIFTRFENPLTGWYSVADVRETRDGGSRLHYRWRMGDDAGENEPVAVPPHLVPTYFLETLARFMPGQEGACFRFVPLNEGLGQPDLLSALICRGTEEIESAGAKLTALRYDWLNLAGMTATTFWRDAAGEIVRVDWGGAIGIPATREAALEGVASELLPVSPR